METKENTMILVDTIVNAPVETVWRLWTTPENIVKWNYASDDWHSPHAENDLREGGRFNYRMEARDGSMGFDFWGVYQKVIVNKYIEYITGDDRKVKIDFIADGHHTKIAESFEPENTNPVELQRGGWQAILDNFKKYGESE